MKIEMSTILEAVRTYEKKLQGVPKASLDPKRTLDEHSFEERRAYAHLLCDLVKDYSTPPNPMTEAYRYFGMIQMILGSTDDFTTGQLEGHIYANIDVTPRQRAHATA